MQVVVLSLKLKIIINCPEMRQDEHRRVKRHIAIKEQWQCRIRLMVHVRYGNTTLMRITLLVYTPQELIRAQ